MEIKRTINNLLQKSLLELKKPANVKLITGAAIFLFITWYNSEEDKEAVLNNPYTTKAEIIRTKNCFKNGKCIDFSYHYEGVRYQSNARVSWDFYKWCKNRNDCKGMKFRLVLEKDNPENILVYWEELYETVQK